MRNLKEKEHEPNSEKTCILLSSMRDNADQTCCYKHRYLINTINKDNTKQ